MIDAMTPALPRRSFAPDRLGVLIVLLAIVGVLTPFASFRANRIVPGKAVGILDALPAWELGIVGAVLLAAAAIALIRTPPRFRFVIAGAALLALAFGIGDAASALTPVGDKISRTSPGTGFWLLFLAFA